MPGKVLHIYEKLSPSLNKDFTEKEKELLN